MYDMRLSGCDDSTRLFDVELSDDEAATVRRIAKLTSEHGGGCQPVLTIGPAPERPADADCTGCWRPIAATSARRRDSWGDWLHGDPAECEAAGGQS
ncbi:hypothetical protein [Pseudonocardia sp. N23]|uniref:hypothetical protein n=1 Tax=Pseudonocardia sp. N23 TaxID=1987376 RepID=UPI000BFCE8AB|nr:hypothetical protein [Pseudonocardia sp. N23]GAY12064.1 hypothetical protein TOK_0454 [Pseudonocardia sp. N23]